MPAETVSNVQTDESFTRYSKAAHLSEFYPYLNGNSPQQQPNDTETFDSFDSNAKLSPIKQRNHFRKPSSTTLNSYTSFSPSTFDFTNLISKSEIEETTESFNEIIKAAEEYGKALSKVSEAAANFGVALERGAKSKGTGISSEGLLNSSGLFFIVANHEEILSNSVKKNFEEPIRSKINQFKLQNIKNENQFKINIKDKIKDLKKQEYENLKISKLKTRNLIQYRSKLLELTNQIDDIDKLKHDYYQDSFNLVQDTSNEILIKLGTIIRAQVEIYEGIAKKGWSGGGLDDLISQCPDPFAHEDEEHNDNDITSDKSSNNNNNDIIDTSNGLSIRRDSQLTTFAQPVITTFQTESLSNSPISKGTLIDALEAQNERESVLKSPSPLEEETNEVNETNPDEEPDEEIMKQLANTTLEDDNSFSLPMPGSSKKREDINTNTILEEDEHQVWR